MYDTVFSDAVVVDGTGADARISDVGVTGDRIACIGDAGTLRGSVMIDAKDLVLAPGFIDFHSHSEWILTSPDQRDLLAPFLLQGVTTFVGGNCGFSPYPVHKDSMQELTDNSRFLMDDTFKFAWQTQSEFMDLAEKRGPLINAAMLTGHGSLRAYIKGNDPSPLTEDEHVQLRHLIRQAKREGSFGISLGLAYVPGVFADEAELETVFRTAAEEDMIITIHGHTYSWTSPFFESEVPHNVKDVRLFISLARKTGAKVNLSHMILKGRLTWHTARQVIAEIEDAVEQGVNISYGAIPYHWGNTLINTLLPKWFLENLHENLRDDSKVALLEQEVEALEAAIGREASDLFLLWGGSDELAGYEGKSFQDISRETGRRDIETILWIMKESDGKAKILTASYSGKEEEYDEPMEMLCAHPLCIMEIDSIVTSTEGPQSPGAYGAFPRVLGRFSRDKKLFSLEETVHKISGMAAKRLGLDDRGEIAVGKTADLVLFDYASVGERSTIADPCRAPEGILGVWMGGVQVLDRDGIITKQSRGNIIRR